MRGAERACFSGPAGGGDIHCNLASGLPGRGLRALGVGLVFCPGDGGALVIAELVEYAMGELDGGEKRVGRGALYSLLGESMDEFVDSDKHGELACEGRKSKRLAVRRFLLNGFGRVLMVVMAAVFRAVHGGRAAALAV